MKPAKRQQLNNLLNLKYMSRQGAMRNTVGFGIEIEQAGISHHDRATLREINQMFHGEKRFTHVPDGSITVMGSEFVSGIMGTEDIPKVQEAVRIIRRHGGRPHSSCGIHIHIDGTPFLNDPKALVRLIKTVQRYELHMYHALKADSLTEGQDRTRERRLDGGLGWSRPVEDALLDRIEANTKARGAKEVSIEDIREAWYTGPDGDSRHRKYSRTRYRLLNLHALFYQGTVEFRCFNPTVHAGKIKAYIQLCQLIACQALLSKRAVRGKRSFEPSKAHYEVRTWLLKLGAIGDEYKTMRLHLTKHLEGNASWHR